MIVWMLFSAAIALIVAAAARAAEWLARLAGYRLRWIWAGALGLTVFLTLSAALRDVIPAAIATDPVPVSAAGNTLRAQAGLSPVRALVARVERFRHSLDAPFRDAAAAVKHAVPPVMDRYAVSISMSISLGLFLVLIGVGRRFRRARRAWPFVSMQGVRVRLAPRVGPVVIGFVRPEIVVPRWLLRREADEQRLVVTHEDEHIRARDPILLGAAWCAVVLAPWSPAVWYMLSRLRLAVELDCDARVLRRGAAPRSYGSLLIDVAQHASALRMSALALADDSSHLHQRILAMKPSVPRYARLRGGLAAAFALAGVLVACQATLPTDADIERMNVGDVARTVRELATAKHADTAVAYVVDGVSVTGAQAESIAPSDIGSVRVVTGRASKTTQIWVKTLKDSLVTGDSGTTQRVALMRDGTAGEMGFVKTMAPLSSTAKVSPPALVLIDGVRATLDDLKALGRDKIETVDVIKGASAGLQYGADAAARGVIVITTKPGGGR